MQDTDGQPIAVPHFAIASSDVGGAAALAAFGASVADVFELALVDGMAAGDYALELSAWHLGTLMIGSFRSSALAFDRSPSHAAGSLDHLLIQLYLEGGFVGTADRQVLDVRPRDIVIFDLSRPLSTVATAFHNISLLIPRTLFESSLEDVSALHGTKLPREAQLSGLLADYLVSLIDRLPRLAPNDAIVSAHATAALAAAVLSGNGPGKATSDDAVRSPYRRIAMHIDARLHDVRLNADQIASEVGMSRAALYRLFEPVGGVALYIRRRRLIRAALTLSAPASRTRRISDVAFENGFTSEATFARAFRQTFGISPTAARSRGSILLTVDASGNQEPEDHQVFAGWVRALQA